MRCWHWGLQRRLLPYIEGDLGPQAAKRLERHLLDCGACRDLMVRLRRGRQMALLLRSQAPHADDQPPFESVAAMAGHVNVARGECTLRWQGWIERLATPGVVGALTLVLVAQLALLVITNRSLLFGQKSASNFKTSRLDLSSFHLLNLQDLKSNTEPRIATQGYVTGVHTDPDERTVAFRLVQSQGSRSPFVVCEIMSPIRIAAPRDGSYVRVYGVSRYDAQAGRNWYEVNPVVRIAVLNR